MQKRSFTDCFNNSKLILTEGAIGLRLVHEYNIEPDKDVANAGLIYDNEARNALSELYGQYLQISYDLSLPIMLLTNTRRANRERVGRSRFSGRDIMGDYTGFLRGLILEYDCEAYVGGMMGCKGDAYSGEGLSTKDAIEFHSWQAEAFMDRKPDFMIAAIMPCLPEAMGMAKVMETLHLPYVISFMICGEGTLLDGHSIHDAIAAIDGFVEMKPLFYMTNCVYPLVLMEALSKPFNRTPLVAERFCGIQANASRLSLSELDGSGEPKTTSPEELAEAMVSLHQEFPLKVYGGCCGTDNTHIREIARRMKSIIC